MSGAKVDVLAVMSAQGDPAMIEARAAVAELIEAGEYAALLLTGEVDFGYAVGNAAGKTHAQLLREQADHIEGKERGIARFRNALKAVQP